MIIAFTRQVVELDSLFGCRTHGHTAADIHDTALRCVDDVFEQAVDEYEMAQMVNEKLFLDAIDLFEIG